MWTDIIVTPCGHKQRYVAPRRMQRQIHHSHLLGDVCLTCTKPGVTRTPEGVLCLVWTEYSTPPEQTEAPKRPTRRSRKRERELMSESSFVQDEFF
jgi:hypothetical protein